MYTHAPNQTNIGATIGNTKSILHWIWGRYLKDTAGIAIYNNQALIPLCASAGTRFDRLNSIPAIRQTPIIKKLVTNNN
jgi:hypothetical protein